MSSVTPESQILTEECTAYSQQSDDSSANPNDHESVRKKLLSEDFEADIEEHIQYDSDDTEAAELFAESQTFVPDIHIPKHYKESYNPKHYKGGFRELCKKMADRAAYSAYLKYGWQGRGNLFSIVYEEARVAYMNWIPSEFYESHDLLAANTLSAQYADDVCMNIVGISWSQPSVAGHRQDL